MSATTNFRRRLFTFLVGITASVGLAAAVHAQTGGPDADGDGVANPEDNCTQTANPDQMDADGDNYGNICDGDLDNNGIVNEADFELLRSVLNQESSASVLAAAADLDGNGRVTAQDFGRLRAQLNAAPGPSGLHP